MLLNALDDLLAQQVVFFGGKGGVGKTTCAAAYAVGAAGLIWLFHIDNIQRLLAGTERRIEFRRP